MNAINLKRLLDEHIGDKYSPVVERNGRISIKFNGIKITKNGNDYEVEFQFNGKFVWSVLYSLDNSDDDGLFIRGIIGEIPLTIN